MSRTMRVWTIFGLTGLLAGFAHAGMSLDGTTEGTDGGTVFTTYASTITGDMDGDGLVTTYDIDPFQMFRLEPDKYAKLYPHVSPTNGDVNFDGVVDTYDIDAFVALLVKSGSSANTNSPPNPVPAPVAVILGLAGLGSALGLRRRLN